MPLKELDKLYIIVSFTSGRGETVDAIGLGPIARKGLGVRVLSSAPNYDIGITKTFKRGARNS